MNPSLRHPDYAERGKALAAEETRLDGVFEDRVRELEAERVRLHEALANSKANARKAVQVARTERSTDLAVHFGLALAVLCSKFGQSPRTVAAEIAETVRTFNARATREIGADMSELHIAFAFAPSDDRIGDPRFVDGTNATGPLGRAGDVAKCIRLGAGPVEIAGALTELEIAVEQTLAKCKPDTGRADAARSGASHADIRAALEAIEAQRAGKWEPPIMARGQSTPPKVVRNEDEPSARAFLLSDR